MIDILLIEDNIELANLIQTFLKKKGFSLSHVVSGEEGFIWLQEHHPRLILLDIMLPQMDGFAFCKQLRKQQEIPILIMSAKSSKSDKLLGFELGADDYMEKPVDPDILCAKIKALLSRFETNNKEALYLKSKDIEIDVSAHKAYLKKQPLELNVKEFELLLLFVRNAGKTLNKDFLFNQIWGCDSVSENQTLTVHIKMLRSKIEDHPREPKRIKTVWGIGYRYEEI